MIRILHRWPGLALATLLFTTALSGAILSFYPAADTVLAPQAANGMTVAELATQVQKAHPGVEQIQRSSSGQISAWWFDGSQPGSAIIDPMTGHHLDTTNPDPLRRWLTTFHRSLFLDDSGRLIVAAGALTMLILTFSGSILIVRRTGGWRRWFSRLRGPLAGRLHVELARVTAPGLLLCALTALWMSAETFNIVTIEPLQPPLAYEASGKTGLALDKIDVLRNTPVTVLRELSFPDPDHPEDTFIIKTDQGMGYVDQGTGTMLAWSDLNTWQKISETIYMLHTGQGSAITGIVLGLVALGGPVLVITGYAVWLTGTGSRPRLKDNASAAQATTIVLVGSESGTTWGFAATLANALRDVGQSVHVAPANTFTPTRYRKVQRFFILTATYGEGGAPSSARVLLEKLQAMKTPPVAPLAVLGFGDRSFPHFCAFAAAVERAARAAGWRSLLPFETIDRQSSQAFTRWGRALGNALHAELNLAYQPVLPATTPLTLLTRRDYGEAIHVPMTILRFALPKTSFWQRVTGEGFARFEAGDLLGILPVGNTIPRLYSLASGTEDGFIEIVVRQHPGGLSSGQLTRLSPGQTVRAFLRSNPAFHVQHDSSPLILIGAGTGLGPLAGFIRRNDRRRAIYLFFGLRSPDSDFLYHTELSIWQSEGYLTQLFTAASRSDYPQYVQDILLREGPLIAQSIEQGGRIMICGGRDMAQGVAEALENILSPIGITPEILKAGGRYVEDIY
ncbi:PepSY domain-containing protein [Entomohabitans teleogrylli]|uniref:PepSY domain-containing protein n=1 Tax=Entomohabitans teleogrylli TaxID=1384589 RepID=UPI00073D6845|nr:PepSY domain-containing protein [Entomohabitans teleogrylli]